MLKVTYILCGGKNNFNWSHLWSMHATKKIYVLHATVLYIIIKNSRSVMTFVLLTGSSCTMDFPTGERHLEKK
jgi:hypothetical protein